jgi:uncharacterized membrane protein
MTHRINLALLLSLLLGSALLWPQLPESIPLHFGADGQPTRWGRPSLLNWFGMPLIALALTALNYGLARWMVKRPSLINLPNKQQFLALPPERQAPVVERMRHMLYGLTAPLLVIFLLVQLAIYRTAHGEPSQGIIVAVLIGAIMMTPLILGVWLPPIQRELDRQLSEHRAEQEREDRSAGRGERAASSDEDSAID